MRGVVHNEFVKVLKICEGYWEKWSGGRGLKRLWGKRGGEVCV